MYLAFDHVFHYQFKVAKLVRKRLNLHIIDKSNTFPSGRKHFLYKFVTHVLNVQRKHINDGSQLRNSTTYTITRYGKALALAKSKNHNRKKCHFYNWMVCKHDVSYILIVDFIQFSIVLTIKTFKFKFLLILDLVIFMDLVRFWIVITDLVRFLSLFMIKLNGFGSIYGFGCNYYVFTRL